MLILSELILPTSVLICSFSVSSTTQNWAEVLVNTIISRTKKLTKKAKRKYKKIEYGVIDSRKYIT